MTQNEQKTTDNPAQDTGQSLWPAGVGRPFGFSLAVGLLILAAQLYPYDFHGGGSGTWLGLTRTDAVALAGNVLLFLPLGLVEFGLGYRLFGARAWVVVLVAIDAAILALVGETAQLWLATRDSSLIDLVANTLGATIGAVTAAYIVDDHDDPAPPQDGEA